MLPPRGWSGLLPTALFVAVKGVEMPYIQHHRHQKSHCHHPQQWRKGPQLVALWQRVGEPDHPSTAGWIGLSRLLSACRAATCSGNNNRIVQP